MTLVPGPSPVPWKTILSESPVGLRSSCFQLCCRNCRLQGLANQLNEFHSAAIQRAVYLPNCCVIWVEVYRRRQRVSRSAAIGRQMASSSVVMASNDTDIAAVMCPVLGGRASATPMPYATTTATLTSHVRAPNNGNVSCWRWNSNSSRTPYCPSRPRHSASATKLRTSRNRNIQPVTG